MSGRITKRLGAHLPRETIHDANSLHRLGGNVIGVRSGTEDRADLPSRMCGLMETHGLTSQMFNYAIGVLAGETLADAYRRSYDCRNSKDSSIRQKAYELRHHPKVDAFITERQKAMAEAKEVTAQELVDWYREGLEIAKAEKNAGWIASNAGGLAKLTGHIVDTRANINIPNTSTPADLAQKIENAKKAAGLLKVAKQEPDHMNGDNTVMENGHRLENGG